MPLADLCTWQDRLELLTVPVPSYMNLRASISVCLHAFGLSLAALYSIPLAQN